MRLLIFFLTILFLSACFNSSDKLSSVDKDFKVNYVDSIIGDGCSESYTYDSVSLDKNKFIFSSDLIEIANIKIDGVDIYLKHDTNYVTIDTQYVDLWKNKSWAIELKLRTVKKTCDECSYNKGTMTIKSGDKIKIIKIHGEGGC